MPRNAASFYENSRPVSDKYVADPWLDMSHVEKRLASKYGDGAGKVTGALKECERARFAERSVSIHRVPAGNDVFQRNLRTLAYIADGRIKNVVDRERTVSTLYTDAMADLERLYPADKKYGDVSPYEVWKHLLESTRDEAQKE